MTVFQDMQKSSWRGVPFLVNSESEQGGKKIASHEYVNSNKRFTEELGELPPKFTVNGIVHGPNAINQRIRLRAALNESGLGTLVHPIYGTVQVKSTTFTINSNQTKIGEFLFAINFESSKDDVTPTPSVTDSATVSKSADDARLSIDSVIGASYEEPTSGDSLNASADKLTEIAGAVSAQVNNVKNPIQSGVAEFNRVVNTIEATAFSSVQEGGSVQGALSTMYTSFLGIAQTPSDLFDAWQNLTEFGSDVSILPTDTFDRAQIANNLGILDQHARLTALAGVFEAATYIEFTTDEQLLAIQDFLDAQYNEQLRDSISDVSVSDTTVVALDPNVRSTFATLRDNTRKTIDQLKENVWRVVDIEKVRSSMALVSYRYYGNIDNLDLLTSLNPGVNVSGFNKAIKGVTK